MVNGRSIFPRIILITLLLSSQLAHAQLRTDSWQATRARGNGTVTALYDEIEPFIYTTGDNKLAGVEYEIMQAFTSYVKSSYNVDVTVDWLKAGAFDSILYKVRHERNAGLFGWAYYSITPARKKEVTFSLPYMPDLNVLVTNNREPMYATAREFTARLPQMKAYSQRNTTMQEDVMKLKMNFFPDLKLNYLSQDYDILKQVEQDPQSFGYVPLSIYIVALQKGIKVKRQSVLASKREGFAAVMPLGSDWKPVMDEFMLSDSFRTTAGNIVARYLGSQVRDLVFGPAAPDAGTDSTAGVELVSLEKEIAVQRLMDSAIQLQKHRSRQNIILVILAGLVIVTAILYNRFRTKQRLSKRLHEHNEHIKKQRDQIEQMNQLLQLKILQTRLNPHFLFNSLNAIQYFVMGDNKATTLQYISRFASFLRKVIRFGDETHITVKDEKELLEDYLWLERCRFQDRFNYRLVVDEELLGASLLPLMTLTLVEEALYEGILTDAAKTDGMITVEFKNGSGELDVSVVHNGIIQADSSATQRSAGTSISMLEQRLLLFNENRKRKIRWMHTGQSANGTRSSTLRIPQPIFENE